MRSYAGVLAFALGAVFVASRVSYQTAQQSRPAGQTSIGARAMIVQENNGEHRVRRWAKRWPFTIKIDQQNGNAQDFYVGTEIMAPGQTIPFHRHFNAEEFLMMEEGGAEVWVGDQHAKAGPRAIVFIPRSTWVSAVNTSGHPIHLLFAFSRQGFERYMRAMSAKEGESIVPLGDFEAHHLPEHGEAEFWNYSKGKYPPEVAASIK